MARTFGELLEMAEAMALTLESAIRNSGVVDDGAIGTAFADQAALIGELVCEARVLAEGRPELAVA